MEVSIYTTIKFTGHQAKGTGIYYIILEYIKPDSTPATMEILEGIAPTTKNRTALQACITALSRLTKDCTVNLYIDNPYITETINQGWFYHWNFEDWTNKGEPVKNADLWKQLFKHLEKYKVTFKSAKSHPYSAYMETQLKHREVEIKEDKP